MSYLSLNVGQRQAVRAFLSPKNFFCPPDQIIDQVAEDIGKMPSTVIRYMALPAFQQVIKGVNEAIKEREIYLQSLEEKGTG